MGFVKAIRPPGYPGARPLPLLLLAALVACVAAAPAAAAPPAKPVLGAKSFAAPYGKGFGTVAPTEIFDGGDPSGRVFHIRWTGWGSRTAIGHGRNPIFKPRGGYYRKPARIELRATRLGRCGKRRAYTRLEARVPKHPGGRLGHWFAWAGAKTICKPPY